jgi:hypothetical protein
VGTFSSNQHCNPALSRNADLQAAINRYVADQNTDRKPFRWKATPDKIIGAAARGHQTLDSIQLDIFVELHWFFVEL